MSERHDGQDDERLERELRQLLGRREPGPAPLVLRERVDRVPGDGPRTTARSRLARAVVPLLGLAAAVLVAVIGAQVLGHWGSAPTAGASPGPSGVASFDPMLEGPGVGAAADSGVLWGLLFVAVVVLASLAIVGSGRRRLVPAAIAVVLVAYGLVGSLAPVDLHVFGWGPGLNVTAATMPPGSSEQVWYEVAPPRQPFSIGIAILQDGSTPVRIEGIQQDAWIDESFVAMRWAAVWVDKASNAGMAGPDRPFAPMDLPRDGLALWLVGRAGQCSIGPSYNPAHAEGLGYTSIPIRVRITVLGWPRVVDLQLPASLIEPNPGMCPGIVPPSPGG